MIYRVKIDFGYHEMFFDYNDSDDAIRMASSLFNHYSFDNSRDIEVSVLLLSDDVNINNEEVESSDDKLSSILYRRD